MCNPAPMLTPVIFIYSNGGYASKDAAWQALWDLGLIELAESQSAVLIVQNPVAGAWGASDVTVYWGILDYNMDATVTINGEPMGLSIPSRSVVLNPPGTATSIAVVVKAANGISLKYTITVNRKG